MHWDAHLDSIVEFNKKMYIYELKKVVYLEMNVMSPMIFSIQPEPKREGP